MKGKKAYPHNSAPILVSPYRELMTNNGRWLERHYSQSGLSYTDVWLSKGPTKHPRIYEVARLSSGDGDFVPSSIVRPDANLRLDARLDLPRKRASLAPVVSPVSPVSPPAAVEAPAITDEDKSWITQEVKQTTLELKADMDRFDTDTYYRAGGTPTIQVVSAFHDEKDKINTYLDKILSTLTQLVESFQRVEERISKIERYVAKIEKYLNTLNTTFDVSRLFRIFSGLKTQIADIQQMAREERKKDLASAIAAISRPTSPTSSSPTIGDLLKAAMQVDTSAAADEPATPKMSRRILFNDGLPTPPTTPVPARKPQ